MQITATIIADSISSTSGKRIITFELEYPRFIHAELMTHRLFSRNAASSRAVPVDTVIKNILANMAKPLFWGKNQPGMTAKEEYEEPVIIDEMECDRDLAWECAAAEAINFAKAFNKAGYHKQITNRLTEPFSMIKTVVTSTDFGNWFWLRDHSDAQPEIAALARLMKVASEESKPGILRPGSWHVPYYNRGFWIEYSAGVDIEGHTLKEALMISSSCCAQVSYRKNDDTLEKAIMVYNRLVESSPVHASPFEHQATPISIENDPSKPESWDEGITHVTRDGTLCSGNFRDWLQYRQLIKVNAVW